MHKEVFKRSVVSGWLPGYRLESENTAVCVTFSETHLLHWHVPVCVFWTLQRGAVPDLLVGLTADLQHLFALQLQLFGEGADVLVERVDLVVQLSDVVLPPGHLFLELTDPAQQLSLLDNSNRNNKPLL